MGGLTWQQINQTCRMKKYPHAQIRKPDKCSRFRLGLVIITEELAVPHEIKEVSGADLLPMGFLCSACPRAD